MPAADMLARRDKDNVHPDSVAGVPDSGIAHAVGYANESGIPFARPFIKYTPTWPRSFMPTNQSQRNLIAKMKLIPVDGLIRDKKLLLIDDSIVRGTQLRETTEFLYHSGAKEVHIRPACPPLVYGCKFLNFSRSSSELDLITRRIIQEREREPTQVTRCFRTMQIPDSQNYAEMVEEIRKRLNFTSLSFPSSGRSGGVHRTSQMQTLYLLLGRKRIKIVRKPVHGYIISWAGFLSLFLVELPWKKMV